MEIFFPIIFNLIEAKFVGFFFPIFFSVNPPLPYPQLVTLFLRHFQIPLDDEPFVQVKRSFAIGAGAVTSFGYRKDRDG